MGRPISRSRSTVRVKRVRRSPRWAARAASNASSSGSIPKPRMCSSPSHSPRSRVTRALISTPGMSSRPGGIGGRRHEFPIAGQRVVVGDGQQPDAGLGGRARPARLRRQDTVGAGRVGVQVDRGRRRRDDRARLAAAGTAWRPTRAGRSPAAGLTPRRAAGCARWPAPGPVAGSMSIWAALNTTGPSPTSKRVGSALMKRGRTVLGSKPMTLHTGPVMPRSVW